LRVPDPGEQILKVCELFESIQGEGAHSGYPCFFVRLAGCNLRCSYCDTAYGWDQDGPEVFHVSVDDLAVRVHASGLRLVQVTGGEPLLQPGSRILLRALTSRGYTCLLETNGSLSVAGLPPAVVKILDWKTPGSGFPASFLLDNLRHIGMRDQIKFVITDRRDYEWSLDRVRYHGLHYICQVIFSPAWKVLSPVELAAWILEDRPFARLQLQLHKQLWGDKKGA